MNLITILFGSVQLFRYSNILSIYNLLFQNLFQTWKSTIFVVSHDRSFLNAVATDILHLHSGVIDNYRGNYESFTKTREERLKNQQKEYEAQKEYRDHIQVQLHVYHSLIPARYCKSTFVCNDFILQFICDELVRGE